jgi:mevalonate kinase
MGELTSMAPGIQSGLGATAMVVSAVALALFAFFGAEQENDDDDSPPGGGLMQPVA